ncbi:universal stress protein [Thermaurantiacus tibetensis]|uniref:universal stress protein n=1 Tax=Thermaurantiacus tibetensis TaxID=2759035 RepID=UPI0018901FF4|nr:universal stress protein [Thermaurantiacus tibetensis]
MKSILLHVAPDADFPGRKEAALDVARAFGGHVHCLQPRRIPAYFGADAAGFGAGAALVAELIEQETEAARQFRQKVEADLAKEDVPFSWEDAVGEPADLLIEGSILMDLIVMSLSSPGTTPQASVAEVLVRAETPVLALPPGHVGIDLTKRAVVAWKASMESAKALRAAVPMLALAEEVVVVVVDPPEGGDLPPTEAARYLSRHGISAHVKDRRTGGQGVAETLAQTVRELGAGWMVMGAYSRSRTIEFLLGGVTRDFLDSSPVPLVMAH